MNLVFGLCILFVASTVCLAGACSDDYFGGTIKCYSCEGASVNSSCGDPFSNKNVMDCRKGACLKWVRLVNGKPILRRTCSKTLDFQIIPINGVCRKESNGEGYMCMCATDFCNSSTQLDAGTCARTFMTLVIVHMVSKLFNRISEL